MILEIRLSNFFSIKDEVVLDMQAASIQTKKAKELEENTFVCGDERLLKTVAIYGANASGKSNIYEAFKFMSYYVEESFKFGGESDGRQKADSDYTRVSPFLFDSKSRSEESTFEVFFVDNSENTGKIYQYGFALQNDEVVEEWWRRRSVKEVMDWWEKVV